jgi:hypothetical protein
MELENVCRISSSCRISVSSVKRYGIYERTHLPTAVNGSIIVCYEIDHAIFTGSRAEDKTTRILTAFCAADLVYSAYAAFGAVVDFVLCHRTLSDMSVYQMNSQLAASHSTRKARAARLYGLTDGRTRGWR